jgi:xanthine dehydrogenase accessory protein XdhC
MYASTSLSEQLQSLLAAGEAVILATVVRAAGSTPREAGACMAVTATTVFGTIGGGRLEWEAVQRARTMIAEGKTADDVDMPLGPAVGQCCGGHVVLRLDRATAKLVTDLALSEAAERDNMPQVLVFGAGHVGRALVRALQPLPVHIVWADTRPEQIPPAAEVEVDRSDGVEVVRRARPGAAVFVMTHSHALDYAITEAALARDDLAYVGLIGSRTKRRRFERWVVARGGDACALQRLVSPIADMGVPDKRPEVIAALAAAELLQALAKYNARQTPKPEAVAI